MRDDGFSGRVNKRRRCVNKNETERERQTQMSRGTHDALKLTVHVEMVDGRTDSTVDAGNDHTHMKTRGRILN